MEYKALRLDVKNYVAVVTLDRPPVNALNGDMQTEIQAVFDEIGERGDVRVAILTGAGRIFCAGADIKARAGKPLSGGAHWAHSRSVRESFNAVMECKRPVIAALNGPALGGGLALAASCDILIASEKAEMALPEINVGVLGGGRHAMRLFGHSRARLLMFSGMRIGADELYRLGIVERVVPQEKLMDAASEIARNLAGKAPLALELAKHAMNTVEFMTIRDGYRFEQNMTRQLADTEDSKEAQRAFVEKREPVFKGR